MRRALTLLTAISLLGLTACLEFNEIQTQIRYVEDEQVFQIRTELRGIGSGSFDCDTPESCVPIIRKLIEQPTSVPEIMELTAKGNEDLALNLVQRGDQLDIVLTYEAPLGTPAADQHGVIVEHYGRPGREKTRLVVASDAGREVLDSERYARRVQLQASAEFGEIGQQEYLVLPRRAREVTTLTTMDPAASDEPALEPIFEGVPGLAEALLAQGLLTVE